MSNRPSNALIRETSPYLLQHAHNPVQWYPWGPEALERAVAEQKPILVSIGYSACHWCHVMEHESFENEQVAEMMNAHFINIKIDREERPDLDHIYMDAVQAMSGSGGWPLNVFLTPDKKPFYGGTYFPPQRAFNRPSWSEVLELIQKAWKEKREEIISQADTLTDHLEKAGGLNALFAAGAPVSEFSKENCLVIAKNLLQQADPQLGGFGKAPKFPQTFSIRCLIQQAWYDRDPSLAHLGLFSLRQLVNGGIYDQAGGGMCRYSTDDQWLVPHFEKMLYDNALLLRALADAYSFTGQDWYRQSMVRTISFLERELKSPEGGYYAALDADSEGEEGKFYVWSYEEIQALLGDKTTDFCKTFHVSPGGNWEGANILNVDDHIPAKDVPSPAMTWEKELNLLLEARNKRVRPGLDDKIILGWNAMLLSAYCRVYAATNQPEMLTRALRLAGFIEKTFYTSPGELLHTYKAGRARFPAFLDDHANYIEALILLGEVTGKDTYREQAYALMEIVDRKFSDAEQVFFYYTPAGQDDVIVRKLECHDGATPSGNAVMAQNLLYLGIVFDKISVRERAVAMCSRLSEAILKYPSSFGIWAGVYQQLAYGMNEIILTGGENKMMEEAIQQVLLTYIPNKVLMGSTTRKEDSLFAGKEFGDEITYYLCRDQHCLEPVKDVDNLLTLIDTESRRKLAIP